MTANTCAAGTTEPKPVVPVGKDVDKTIDRGFGFKEIRAALDAGLVMENDLDCDNLLDPLY